MCLLGIKMCLLFYVFTHKRYRFRIFFSLFTIYDPASHFHCLYRSFLLVYHLCLRLALVCPTTALARISEWTVKAAVWPRCPYHVHVHLVPAPMFCRRCACISRTKCATQTAQQRSQSFPSRQRLHSNS